MSVAAILGGGPSLPADMTRLPTYATLISVNHHAFRLCLPDYLVYMDLPSDVPALQAAIETAKRNGVRIVCPRSAESDVQLVKGQWWDGGFSSTLAAWFGLHQGFDTVVLCGMDCYQGEKKYFYERNFYHPVYDTPLESHLRAWRLAFKHCPNPERLRAMSGPLVDVFGEYED